MKISPHFSLAEFSCHDAARTPYPKAWLPRLKELCALLEVIRACFDEQPVKIVSGYRTVAWNKRVGGKPGSYHLLGMAADIVVPGFTAQAVHDEVLYSYHYGAEGAWDSLGGLGSYATFTHVDIRQSDRLVRWQGGRRAL